MNVDDYVRALDVELRDQPRHVRRAESSALREHLGELPSGAFDELSTPAIYAREYRAQRALVTRPFIGRLRRIPVAARIAIVVFVLAVAAVATIPPWVTHYQPLTLGVFYGQYGSTYEHGEHDSTVLTYLDQARIVLGMTVRNSGPFDATLTRYDDGPLNGVLKFLAVRTTTSIQNCCWNEGHVTHFPLRIASHSTLTVMIELRMTNCEDYTSAPPGPGITVGYSTLDFPMKTLGVHHVVVAPLDGDQKLFIDMPGGPGTTCPRNRSN